MYAPSARAPGEEDGPIGLEVQGSTPLPRCRVPGSSRLWAFVGKVGAAVYE